MKNFGFGCMRMPMDDKKVVRETFCQMVDAFLAAGFTYFDTAHGYNYGDSELALRDCLTSRYPREKYVLTDKLSNDYFTCREDIIPMFESQLAACGVEYFDYYLMHSQNADNYGKYVNCGAYEIGAQLKREGRIKHFGISFHDKAAVLERILSEQPGIEVVQIQFNYADYDDPVIESRRCYEICRKYGKKVIVMEPVRGGSLADLPDDAKAVFEALNGGSCAGYAIRFAASFEGVMMVLSGMSSMQQVEENTAMMSDFKPLSAEEFAAVDKVRDIFKAQNLIGCTGCKYCVDGCPAKIRIPRLFSCMNNKKRFKSWNAERYYGMFTQDAGKASDCIKCGKCEASCPQHLPIRSLMAEVAAEFEKE